MKDNNDRVPLWLGILVLIGLFSSFLYIVFMSPIPEMIQKSKQSKQHEVIPVPDALIIKDMSVPEAIETLKNVKKYNHDNVNVDIVIKKSKKQINSEIEKEYNLPTGMLSAIHEKETSGRCKVTSDAGAVGCFQIMPTTEKYIEKKFNVDIDPTNYRSSAKGSAIYLVYLKHKIERHYPELNNEVQWGLALASYNAGPVYGLKWAHKVEKNKIKTVSEATKFITYKESRQYVKDIGEAVFGEKYTVKSGDTLFGIAKKKNVSVDTLLAEVGTSDIKPGQVIRIE